MDVRWSKGCVIPTSESSHVQPLTNFKTEKLYALKGYESTEVDRTTWLHTPSGTPLLSGNDTRQVVEICKETVT